MNYFIKHWKLSTLVVLEVAVAMTVLWFATPYPRGMLVAQIDLMRGHQELKMYGLSPSWYGYYGELLEEKYNVRLNYVAGCVVPSDLAYYVGGYNSVVESSLQSKFGENIFEICAQEAQLQWEREFAQDSAITVLPAAPPKFILD